uniref:Uncharacterized protein n=1 Tax=Arundo donax TaxID=35708 RepID=A0A0A9EQX1_ARUDO
MCSHASSTLVLDDMYDPLCLLFLELYFLSDWAIYNVILLN